MPDRKALVLPCVATIFTILHTSADADHGMFPKPDACASFFSIGEARKALSVLVEAEKEDLDSRYNVFIENEEDAWEANEDDYAAALFTRYEIVSSSLYDATAKERPPFKKRGT